ncbi:MAG TPA: lytic transglycosylase domain-containing protein [Edaphobacter sp.]|nr:lytic transglycosylase domain-containing protein [Edaphobacter sp.]
MRLKGIRHGLMMLAVVGTVCPLLSQAAEQVTLRNGFELNCVRREAVGDKVRLYLPESSRAADSGNNDTNYLEVAADAIVRVETVPDAPRPVATVKASAITTGAAAPTAAEMREMLAHAGAAHDIDTDLLASVVKAESGGHVRAVSRTGARGLMQLMPGTATAMGVQDAFRPEQNIAGGTAYLDELLTRYRNNIALALAAYNAGPAAVDRYHGVPPYRETKEYVARVIREFNRRKQMALVARAQ